MSVSSGDGHASGAFANPSWNPMVPIHAQGCNVLTQTLHHVYCRDAARDWNRIEGNWKLKGKIKEK
jgi:hypothetical protein